MFFLNMPWNLLLVLAPAFLFHRKRFCISSIGSEHPRRIIGYRLNKRSIFSNFECISEVYHSFCQMCKRTINTQPFGEVFVKLASYQVLFSLICVLIVGFSFILHKLASYQVFYFCICFRSRCVCHTASYKLNLIFVYSHDLIFQLRMHL